MKSKTKKIIQYSLVVLRESAQGPKGSSFFTNTLLNFYIIILN